MHNVQLINVVIWPNYYDVSPAGSGARQMKRRPTVYAWTRGPSLIYMQAFFDLFTILHACMHSALQLVGPDSIN